MVNDVLIKRQGRFAGTEWQLIQVWHEDETLNRDLSMYVRRGSVSQGVGMILFLLS